MLLFIVTPLKIPDSVPDEISECFFVHVSVPENEYRFVKLSIATDIKSKPVLRHLYLAGLGRLDKVNGGAVPVVIDGFRNNGFHNTVSINCYIVSINPGQSLSDRGILSIKLKLGVLPGRC